MATESEWEIIYSQVSRERARDSDRLTEFEVDTVVRYVVTEGVERDSAVLTESVWDSTTFQVETDRLKDSETANESEAVRIVGKGKDISKASEKSLTYIKAYLLHIASLLQCNNLYQPIKLWG